MATASRRYVIIGNGAAGTSAAETLRKGDPQARIILITDEPHALYNRVALPVFLKDEAPEEKVFLRDATFHEQNRIELYRRTQVVRIDPGQKAVYTHSGQVFGYDKLLIATGGRPRPLEVPGAHGAANIYNFHTLDQTKAMRGRLATARRGVVVGGSYIAYELAEAFRRHGLAVTWLIRGPRFLHRVLDEEGGALVDEIAREHGVAVAYGEEVVCVATERGAVCAVGTSGGGTVAADLVGVGLGLHLNTQLAAGAGARIGRGIVTDGGLQTTVPDIYAAGDVAECYHGALGRHRTMGTWNNALAHGKLAATNMAGGCDVIDAVPTYTTGLFGSKISVIGTTPESDTDLESVVEIDRPARNYRRLFYRDRRLVGAVLIGDMRARRQLLQAIKADEAAAAGLPAVHAG